MAPDEASTTVQEKTAETPAVAPTNLKKTVAGLRRNFGEAAAFFKQDKGFQPAAIITGILLGTTALATPVLGTMVGAGLGLGLGLYLLMKTGDVVVDNTAALGKKAGISSMALGIGLGVLTSLPELFVSTAALAAGDASIAISNITGSNIANLLLILGGTAALRKIESKGTSWKFNAVAMAGSTAILGTQVALGVLNPVAGAAMLGALGLYMWRSYKLAQKDAAAESKPAEAQPSAKAAEDAAEKAKRDAAQAEEDKNKPETKAPKWLNAAWALAGVAGLVGAAAFTVSSAVAFAGAMGVSTAVVGILAVAVGTSLPELVVNLKAAKSGDTDMAVGNIMGSCVFNILGIGSLLALKGTAVPALLNPRQSLLGMFNTLAFGGSAALAAGTMAKTKGTIDRKTGLLWMGLYAAFTAANVILGRSHPAAAATPAALPPPKPF